MVRRFKFLKRGKENEEKGQSRIEKDNVKSAFVSVHKTNTNRVNFNTVETSASNENNLPPNTGRRNTNTNIHENVNGNGNTHGRINVNGRITPLMKKSHSKSSKTPRISNMTMIPPTPPISSSSSSSSPSQTHKHYSFAQNGHHHSTSTSIASHATGATTGTSGTASTRKLPRVFTLIEQGEWERVSVRVKRHPHECKKWVYMKRKRGADGNTNHPPSSSSSISQSSPINSLHSVSSVISHNSTSHATVDTLNTNASSTAMSYAHQKAFTSVKCKALHHACHKLRNVHSQIGRSITAAIDEMNHHYNSIPPPPPGSKSLSPPTTPKLSRPLSPTMSRSSPTPLKLERKSTMESIASCGSCNITEGLSFDDCDNPNPDSSAHIAGRISPTFGRIVSYVKESISSPPSSSSYFFQSKNEEELIWDDPWIEACKSILTILEICPEAARERETRHGCLPIHLAAFAMCPTPTATLPKDYVKFKYHSNRYTTTSSLPCSPPTPKRAHGGQSHQNNNVPSHKEMIAASNQQQQQFQNDNNNLSMSSLPPRPLQLLRGGSNGSAVSCASAPSSIGGFSASLMEGGGCSVGTSSWTSDKLTQELDESMSALEEKLRFQQNSPRNNGGGNGGSGSGGMTDKEELELLDRCARPKSIGLNIDRGSSIESLHSACSLASTSSTVVPSVSLSKTMKQKEFYLDKYIANAERREEYSLKVINALLNAYKKGVEKDSEGGRLPLHTAVAGRATFQVIEALANIYPGATRYRTKEGSLALHLAAYYGVSDDKIAPMLLRHYPDASVGKNRWERSPLEEALLMGGENGRLHQIKLIEALRRPSFYWTNQFDPQLFNRGIYGYTNMDGLVIGDVAALKKDEKRMVCVDDNFEEEEAEERLLSLIRRQEWQTIVERTEDFIPIIRAPLLATVQGGYNAKTSVLHLTCEQNPTYEVVDTLVSACPGAVTWRMNPGGQLPLHLATTWKASLSVIGFLLAANPLSARQVDCLGNLPLHCACFSGASEEIIESLLCTNPNGVNKRNKQGSTPQDVVRRLSHRNKKSVLSLFERVSLELLKHKRRSSMNHVQDSVDIRNGTNAETMQMKKKSRGGKKEKAKTVKATQIVNVNIKTQIPAENDDVLWV